jgi:hypothetical protein
MLWKKCSCEIGGARSKKRLGNKSLAVDLGECIGKKVSSNLPELPNITFMVVICWVLNGKNFVLTSKQLQDLQIDMVPWEEKVDFIDKNASQRRYTCYLQCSCASWSRSNWVKSIWNYIHAGKGSITPHIAIFHTTVAFQMLSS